MLTRDQLADMIRNADNETKTRIVGRALVVLFERQTMVEQQAHATTVSNNIGFAGCDARSGTLSAKAFLKNHTIQWRFVERWIKADKHGRPYICKYHKQLAEAAEARAARRAVKQTVQPSAGQQQ